MSATLSGAFALLRRVPRRPFGPLLNSSGRAGPRRLAVLALILLSVLTVILVVLMTGRSTPVISRDARLKVIDPLPGGLHSTPEQDALALSVTDQQAANALHKGVSYTPAMAPSRPATPLSPPQAADAAAPGAVSLGRPARPAPRVVTPVVTPIVTSGFPPPTQATVVDATPAPQLRPTPIAATPAETPAQLQAYTNQINSLFAQWGGHLPRTDVVMPPAQPGADDPDAMAAPSAGISTRARGAAPTLPVGSGAVDHGQILVPAGRGVYAHPVLALSSDETSPAVFQADSGPIAEDRMTGSFSRQANRLIIHISTIIHRGEEISCDGVVIAPDTMEASVATGVDEHYIARFALPAAAAFVAGLGQAIEQTSNTTAVLSPLGGATATTHLNLPQQLGVAAGTAASQLATVINQEAPKGPTISLETNVAVGIMFLSNVVGHRS